MSDGLDRALPESDTTPARVEDDPTCAAISEKPDCASIEILGSLRELLATPPAIPLTHTPTHRPSLTPPGRGGSRGQS